MVFTGGAFGIRKSALVGANPHGGRDPVVTLGIVQEKWYRILNNIRF